MLVEPVAEALTFRPRLMFIIAVSGNYLAIPELDYARSMLFHGSAWKPCAAIVRRTAERRRCDFAGVESPVRPYEDFMVFAASK